MLKRKYTQLLRKLLLGAIPFVVILITWQIFHDSNQDLGWLIPSPLTAAKSFVELLLDGTFFRLIVASMQNLIPAFALGITTAIVLGVAMGSNKTIHQIFYPLLGIIYPVPSLAWLPFVVLLLGFTREAVWAVIFISTFTKMIYNVIGGVKNINIEYILVARNFGFSKLKIIWSVILPAALPQIMTGLRIGFGSAWKSLIGAEMLVAALGGLGTFIWTAQWHFRFDHVVAGVLVISLMSVLIESVVFKRLEEATLVKWGSIRKDYSA